MGVICGGYAAIGMRLRLAARCLMLAALVAVLDEMGAWGLRVWGLRRDGCDDSAARRRIGVICGRICVWLGGVAGHFVGELAEGYA